MASASGAACTNQVTAVNLEVTLNGCVDDIQVGVYSQQFWTLQLTVAAMHFAMCCSAWRTEIILISECFVQSWQCRMGWGGGGTLIHSRVWRKKEKKDNLTGESPT